MKSEKEIMKQLELQKEFLKEALTSGDGKEVAREKGAVNILKWVLEEDYKECPLGYITVTAGDEIASCNPNYTFKNLSGRTLCIKIKELK